MAVTTLDTPQQPEKPGRLCPACLTYSWWWRTSDFGNAWVCGRCHPNPGEIKNNNKGTYRGGNIAATIEKGSEPQLKVILPQADGGANIRPTVEKGKTW